MKKVILIVLAQIFFVFALKAQQFEWLKDIKYCDQNNWTDGVAVGNNGDVYVSGGFNGPGVFTAKYSPSGNLIWEDTSNCTGANNIATTGGLVVDASGNAYVSVYLRGTIAFGNNFYSGFYDMYLIKYNTIGQLQWVKFQGGVEPRDIGIDKLGSVYVSGLNSFTCKYDNSGNNVLCIFSNGKTSEVAIDGVGHIYSEQSTYWTNQTTLNKYTSGGSLIWSAPIPLSKIAVDLSGNCYSSDAGVMGTSSLTKIDSSGQQLWSFYIPIMGAHAICTDGDENIYVSGPFVINNGFAGMRICKYDHNGNLLWSHDEPNPNGNPYVFKPSGISVLGTSVYISGSKAGISGVGFLLKLKQPKDISTSIPPLDKENKLTISPNPTNDVFSVNYKIIENPGIVSLKIFDVSGKCIYTKTFKEFTSEMTETVDMSSYSKGVYTIELSSSKHREFKKLVVQ